MALAWLLARDEHILLIPGTSSVAHLEENHAAADLVLDREDLESLEQVRQLGDPHDAVRDDGGRAGVASDQWSWPRAIS